MRLLQQLVSLITIVNNEKIYQGFKKNLAQQREVNYELIKIQNDAHQYDSARLAYNKAAKHAKGELLIFLHPDIRFLDELALHDIIVQIKYLDNWGVVGIAGCPNNSYENNRNYIVTTLVQDQQKENVGERITDPTKVQTVDECFFVIRKSFLKEHPFSEITGWHFYAVEQSLVSLINGLNNYVVPARIWHLSPGSSENIQYIKIGQEIVKKYGKNFNYINTTVEQWNTHGIKRFLMPWVNLVGHKAKREVKQYPALYETIRRTKHLLYKKN